MNPGAVLVTGAGGFIGRALCDAFRARGLDVVGVDLVGDGKEVVAGSVENPAPWEHLLDRVQLVVHTAALWKSGERPQLKTSVLEGDVGLSI